MLLRLLLILFVKSVACFDEEEFITINESSAYCSLHKVYGVDEIKLVCNLQQKVRRNALVEFVIRLCIYFIYKICVWCN